MTDRGSKEVVLFRYDRPGPNARPDFPLIVEGRVVNEKAAAETKKPYKAPVLSEYGDIRQITQANLNMIHNDNVNQPTHKS
jgi:hypothetical protein